MAYMFKRGRTYHVKYYRGGKQKEKSLRTDSLQIAKERKRQLESALAGGGENPLPTRTPLPEVLDEYIRHIRAAKTPKAAQTDIYYLREAFGPVCDGLTITSRTVTGKMKKRPSKASKTDRRKRLPVIEANAIEEITTRQIADFIDFKVRDQGLKPKTANHYRSIIRRVFNWASDRGMIRLPGGINPASKVQPYREYAPEIRFLTLPQIAEQLDALRFKPQLQTMVAMLIYAGLRREELTWLTLDDIDLRRRQGTGHGIIRTLYDGEHKPIVDVEVFDKVTIAITREAGVRNGVRAAVLGPRVYCSVQSTRSSLFSFTIPQVGQLDSSGQ